MAVKKSLHNANFEPLTGDEIRSTFLTFFAERTHKIIPSASLIPEDPTVLLTIAGMLPFKPIFLGQRERPAARATSSQKCIRTNDIENVGRTARHHTFFEMLGNFSFGDYFKQQAIEWAWELTTEVFGIHPNNLVVSVYAEDTEAEQIWRDVIGINPRRIIRLGKADNFWSSGPTGPCGPCSEIYFDFNPELGDAEIDLENERRFIEFYNLVFMQYNRDIEGQLTPLANCNIDTGMGLERMAQILQKVPNNYETDLIFPLIEKISQLANIDYFKVDNKNKTSLKIIADHSRAVTQLAADGVVSSNLGRGYILRRLIRRMVRHGQLLGITDSFVEDIGEVAIDLMKNSYPSLELRRKEILSELRIEESRFLETLDRGQKLLDKLLNEKIDQISGFQAFELYDTYGFPLELTQEIAEEYGVSVDKDGFDVEMNKQRMRAKSSAVSIDLTLQGSVEKLISQLPPTKFIGFEYLDSSVTVLAILVDSNFVQSASFGQKIKIILDETPFFGESGGQVGDRGFLIGPNASLQVSNVIRKQGMFIHSAIVDAGSINVRDQLQAKVNQNFRRRAQSNHTSTHLLQSALKKVVDSSVGQRGSLVAFDRLRFDFNSPAQVSDDELQRMEGLVNQWINESHPIVVSTMPIKKALESGALAMFGEKYGEIVRVVDVPGVSMELCGGTHVSNTSELGAFKIISECGVASGIRRIEAISGPSLLDYLNERDNVVRGLTDRFKAQPNEIIDRVVSLQKENKALVKELMLAKEELALSRVSALADKVILSNKRRFLVERIDGISGNSLQTASLSLLDQLGEYAGVVLGGMPDPEDKNKVALVTAFSKELVSEGFHAGHFIGIIAKVCGGGGGGRPHLAQAGGRNTGAIDNALQVAKENLQTFKS